MNIFLQSSLDQESRDTNESMEEEIVNDQILLPVVKLGFDKLVTAECEYYKCPKLCKYKSKYHPEFIQADVIRCSFCVGVEETVKLICEYRGYKLLHFDGPPSNNIKYLCDNKENPHECSAVFDNFKKGDGCKKCKRESYVRIGKINKCEKSNCNCKELKLGTRIKNSYLCEHYNFAILFPELAKEWDYVLNEELPNKILPKTNEEYWFRCEKYGICYLASIASKVYANTICPYCSGQRVCLGNSLLVTHSEIMTEWNFDDNLKYPTEVTYGSNYIASWLCKEVEGEIHKYEKKVSYITSKKKTGCSECIAPGMRQLKGGREVFIEDSNKIHDYKYSYDKVIYVDSKTPVNIYCPIISKSTSEPHGYFFQRPRAHKTGAGCSLCSDEQSESRGIKHIKTLLENLGYRYNTDYFMEQKFEGLKYINSLRIDIVLKLPGERKGHFIYIFIEFDGKQHFYMSDFCGTEEKLKIIKERDFTKDIFCIAKGFCLFRFPYNNLPTLENLKNLIELSKTKQVYYSYTHFIERVETDLSNITVIPQKIYKN